jgi:hypothetical protein
MKILTAFLCTVLSVATSPTFAQCQPIGWTLVDQKLISVTERVCVYEKNGARVSIMVSGFCPFSPC